jgi:hypothetical protein
MGIVIGAGLTMAALHVVGGFHYKNDERVRSLEPGRLIVSRAAGTALSLLKCDWCTVRLLEKVVATALASVLWWLEQASGCRYPNHYRPYHRRELKLVCRINMNRILDLDLAR